MSSDSRSEATAPLKCGVVMPISSIDGCPESHWLDVRLILNDAIEDAGFEAHLVSDADDIGIIQKRIIQNLYANPIVVCDVSGKNPNVMFELGLRLAFDKPTIIVKDDKTSYSFDTGSIEHIEYPRDLRFSQIVEFKETLAKRIKATHSAASTDPQYTTFLKHFGTFSVAALDSKEVTGDELILDEIRELRIAMSSLQKRNPSTEFGRSLDSHLYGELIKRTKGAIKTFLKDRNLSRKTDIRREKRRIQSYVLREIEAGTFFSERHEFDTFFNGVFSLLYE